jgi:hypothetical protein
MVRSDKNAAKLRPIQTAAFHPQLVCDRSDHVRALCGIHDFVQLEPSACRLVERHEIELDSARPIPLLAQPANRHAQTFPNNRDALNDPFFFACR